MRKVILELESRARFVPNMSRRDRVQEQRRASAEAKERILHKIDGMRGRDPNLQVSGRDSVFPVLIVTGEDDTIDELVRDADVKNVQAGDEELHLLKEEV